MRRRTAARSWRQCGQERSTGARPARFPQSEGDRRKQGERDRREYAEHGRPAAKCDRLAADQRGGHRDHAEYRHHACQQVRRLFARVEIAHDGACDDRPARHSGALREAKQHHLLHGTRRDGAGAGHQKQAEAGKEHRLAAVAVGHRSPGELPHGKAKQVGGDGSLRGAGGGAERLRDHGHRRQEHVHAERRECDQNAQQERIWNGSLRNCHL